MEEAKQELLDDIQCVTDMFYQNRLNEGIKRMPELVQKLAGYMSALSPSMQQQYLGAVKAVMEAMEVKNYIMLADVLTFEILDLLEQ